MRKYTKYFFGAILLLLLGMFIRTQVFEIYLVKSEGMLPNLLKNDYVLVNKMAYGFRSKLIGAYLEKPENIRVGDVVLFESPLEDAKPFIKRVVAIGGDEILYRGGKLYVNGELRSLETLKFWDSSYSHLAAYLAGEKDFYVIHKEKSHQDPYNVIAYEFGEKKSFGPLKVPDHSVFVMGDNRPASRDSRFFGAIAVNSVIGKASLLVFSCEKMFEKYPILCIPSSIRFDRVFTKIP
jgi:signal peptidase I